jgi:hypothetical protein
MAIPYDRSSLETYQQKLFDLIQVVPGYWRGARPVPTGDPSGVWSGPPDSPNDVVFKNLTNMNQASLEEKWRVIASYTTCNDFCNRAAQEMGITQVNTGQFEVASWLAAVGLARAWVPNSSGARPRYGDIFRSAGMHRGVSLECEGDVWNTIEGGQGGKGAGRDGVARFSQSWSSRDITGWIDVGKLLSLNAPLPSWLGGWWKVKKEPNQDYFYFFEVGGSVYRTQDEPTSGVMPPPVVQPQGAFSIVRGFQTVEIHWRSIDPVETLRVATSLERIDQWTRAAQKDTLDSLPGHYPIVHGRRLPGPAHTGRSN